MFMIHFGSAWALAYSLNLLLMISMDSFFSFWTMMELNLVLFIGVLAVDSSRNSSASNMIKYFVTQGFASTILLMASLTLALETQAAAQNIACAALLVKLGVAPFHSWFISLAAKTAWGPFMLLSTLQKIGPLIALAHFNSPPVLALATAISVPLSSQGAWAHPQIRPVLAFSSVFSTAWMALMASKPAALLFLFAAYSANLTGLVALLLEQGTTQSNQGDLAHYSLKSSILIFLMLLNLSGMPPFLGMYVKMNMITLLASEGYAHVILLFMVQSMWFMMIYTNLGVKPFLSSKTTTAALQTPSQTKTLFALVLAALPVVIFM